MQDLTASPPGSHPSARARTVSCICLLGLLEAVISGMLFPFFSLRLRADGLSPALIGLNATCGMLGILLCGRCFPGLIRYLGYRAVSLIGFLGALMCVAALLLSRSAVPWFAIRLLLGICQAVLWVSTEAWLNHVAGDMHRGRVVGLFQAIYSLGFFLGPGVIYLAGYAGRAPIVVMMLMCVIAIAALPLSSGAPTAAPDAEQSIRWRSVVGMVGAKDIFGLALLVGVCETAIFTLLPVYGIDYGLSAHAAISVLLAYLLGEVVITFPLGWLADRIDRGHILAFSACLACLCLLLLPAAIHSAFYAKAVAFVAGGLTVSLYNTALILLGARFARAELPVLSTVFSMAYAVGSLAGAAAGGASMSALGPAGLTIVTGGCLGCAGALLLGSLAIRRMRQARR
jgi:MFS family permease